jgi:tight adherence protein B
MRRGVATLAALLAVLVPASAAAGEASQPATAVQGITRIGDHSVRLRVKAARDLQASDVSAMLGDRLARVTSIDRVGPRRPLHLVLAIDTSGSMAGAPVSAAIASGERLLDSVGAGDRVGLVVFDDTARVIAPPTAGVDAVRNALGAIATAKGTALYDGVLQAARLTGRDPAAERVVVVLSDGADTSSAATLSEVLAGLRGSGIEVEAVGLTSSGSFTDEALRQITSASGGTFVSTASVGGLEPIATQLAQQRLATDYAIDIALPHTTSRALDVSVKGAPATRIALPAGVTGAGYGFWHSFGALLVSAIAAATVLAIALLLLTWATNRPRTLASRLSLYSANVKVERRSQGSLMADMYESLEQELGNRWAWKRLDTLNERAGASSPTGRVVVVIACCAIVPAAVLLVALGALFALPGLVAGALLPVGVLRARAVRRQRQFDAQLPELLSVWASALRAGRSFAQALDTIVDEAADPARAEFRRAQNSVRLGVPVEQALDEMSQRLGSESFELVVLTTDVQRRIGGNVAEIFDQVADTVRKRQQFGARVRALTAMGVLSARVLLAMPFGIAAVLTLLNRDYMSPLFTTAIGHDLIVIALVMMTVGYLVLRRMVRPRAIA